jgi:hypothetical protein
MTLAASKAGTSWRKRWASRGVQASGWKMSPVSTRFFSRGLLAAAPSTGASRDGSAARSPEKVRSA